MSSNEQPVANPFQSLRDYEEFVYTLKERYPIIQRLTLVVVPRGKRVAVLQGELTFEQGYRVTVRERLSMDAGPVVIEFYGYEIWHNADKVAWYDAQPHPDDPTLQSTHPHTRSTRHQTQSYSCPADELYAPQSACAHRGD